MGPDEYDWRATSWFCLSFGGWAECRPRSHEQKTLVRRTRRGSLPGWLISTQLRNEGIVVSWDNEDTRPHRTRGVRRP